MDRAQYPMPLPIDHGCFPTGCTSPQHEDQTASPGIQHFDDPIGELLPPLLPMAVGLMSPHREHGIQQQDALIRPMGEVAMLRNRHTERRVQLLVDVLQRRRNPDPTTDGKAQPVGLTGAVVGVLAQDDDANSIEGCVLKCVEDLGSRGKHPVLCLLLEQKRPQCSHVWLLELVFELSEPRRIEPNGALIRHVGRLTEPALARFAVIGLMDGWRKRSHWTRRPIGGGCRRIDGSRIGPIECRMVGVSRALPELSLDSPR